jgi:hypothetical protein
VILNDYVFSFDKKYSNIKINNTKSMFIKPKKLEEINNIFF